MTYIKPKKKYYYITYEKSNIVMIKAVHACSEADARIIFQGKYDYDKILNVQ